MKKSATNFLFILFVILGLISNAFAQAPEGITYQAEALDSKGNPLCNEELDVKIRIVQDSEAGFVVYEELHNVLTSNKGMFVLTIGKGINNSGLFEYVDWGNYSHFLNVQVKKAKENSWTDMGTSQLLSVPYALHSKTADNLNDGEKDPVFTLWDKSTGISITESQITDLKHFTTEDEIDPVYSVAPAASITDAGSGAVITEAERIKLSGIAEGAEVNVQSDWNEADNTKDAYIANKPTNVSAFTNDAGYLTSETDPSVPTGTQTGDMQYWNGSEWVTVAAGNEGEVLTFTGGVPKWTTTIGGNGGSDVLNPTTGKTWMDRNLGASQVATSSTDADSYGDLFQWGRAADGHEKRTSGTTTTLSNSDTPGHGDFITPESSPNDWRSPQNDNLWQGVNGTNNPCPGGYRLPTEAEWEAERISWSSNNAAGAFASPLKLPVAGYRDGSVGSLDGVGSDGYYWSSNVDGTYSRRQSFGSSYASMNSYYRAFGRSVRCLKDSEQSSSMPSIETNDAYDITQTTATISGNVTSDGGTAITERGFYWSQTNTNPGSGDNKETVSGTTGSFNKNISGLQSNTIYYYRAFATNSEGTSTGFVENFATCGDWIHDTQTAVVPVTNPATGKTWMDRNLGASQVATSSTDAASYGDLYQWGRATDGHEKRTSGTTITLSSSDTPGHGDFITVNSSPYDWRSPQNDNLWQGVNGTNNPCPGGYRLPTKAEWDTERQTWSSNDAAGAFASPLKLPMAGFRNSSNDVLLGVGSGGYYKSSTVNGNYSQNQYFYSSDADISSVHRAYGSSVRCLKDLDMPSVETNDAYDITQTTATISGNVTSDGGTAITERGFYWSQTNTNPGSGDNKETVSGTTGSFNKNISGLQSNTTYYYLAFATNSEGTSTGFVENFATFGDWIHDTQTAVVPVTNPATGKTWMDRNLGASQVATSSTDAASYGDLYQWGRATDGHEKRTSVTTTTLSSSNFPGHRNFILAPSSPYDWRNPQNDNLWQGVNGTNNPCPEGYRLPTAAEWYAERLSWSSNNTTGAFASPLKLPVAGSRYDSNGSLNNVGSYGSYWSSTVDGTFSRGLYFFSSNAGMYYYNRAYGRSVRCLKD